MAFTQFPIHIYAKSQFITNEDGDNKADNNVNLLFPSNLSKGTRIKSSDTSGNAYFEMTLRA